MDGKLEIEGVVTVGFFDSFVDVLDNPSNSFMVGPDNTQTYPCMSQFLYILVALSLMGIFFATHLRKSFTTKSYFLNDCGNDH